MAISILNNIASLAAENQLSVTQNNLQKTLFQLSSGSRINTGADDAAGLAIANGLQANITALSQSSMNANEGVGSLQVADGALAQVTTLLNRAVTLATESATGTVGTSQRGALQAEYSQIQNEIDNIGSTTSYNGTNVFGSAQSVFLSDGKNQTTISTNTVNLSSAQLLGGGSSAQMVMGSLTAAGGDSVTVGGITYTFVKGAAGTAANQTLSTAQASSGTATAVNVLQDTNTGDSAQVQLQNSMNNLVAAINHDASQAGTAYGSSAAVVANPFATASANGLTLSLTSTPAGFANYAAGAVPVSFTQAGSGTGVMTVVGGGTTMVGGATVQSDISTAASAQAALSAISSAIATVAADRGNIGAVINRLQAASSVETNQVQNLTSAENGIMAADIPTAVSNLSQYTILNQSGISALAQANSAQQSILKLLQ
jgi:flagellin